MVKKQAKQAKQKEQPQRTFRARILIRLEVEVVIPMLAADASEAEKQANKIADKISFDTWELRGVPVVASNETEMDQESEVECVEED